MNALLDNQLWENQNQLTASRNVQVRFYTDWPIPVSRPVRFFLLLTALLYRRRMADNKKWFKIWTTILTDPHLFTIPLEDFARWFILGALMATHGTGGKITVSKKQLCNLFRSDNDNDMKNSLNNMPNITWSNDNDTITVIMEKWYKYQVDSSTYERLARHRKKANDNGVRREEKRREKKRKEQEDNILKKEETNLPNWIPLDTFNAFIEMRKSLRKPLTSKAQSLLIGSLDRLRAEGNDVGKVLEQSIMNSWQGVFPLKEKGVYHATNRKCTQEEDAYSGLGRTIE